MPEKPIPPKKEKIGYSPYVIGVIIAIIISFFIVSYSRTSKERDWYESDLAKYNQAVADYGHELNNYYSEVLSYVRSIDPKYDIDNKGTIPVIADVQWQKDPKSQYIGSEFSYYFSINENSIRNRIEFRLSIFHEVIFKSEIIENDPSSDDVGIEKDSISISFLDLNDGFKHKHTVNVREKYGRDAGHVAIFNVSYSITPKQTLELSALQKASFPKYPILPNEPNKKEYSLSFWDVVKNYSDVKLYIAITFIVSMLLSYYSLVYKPQKKYKKAYVEYEKANEEYISARNDLIQKLSGKTIRELAGVPDFVFFTDDDLPYTRGDDRRFGAFTLYITPSGSCFHREKTCRKSAFPIHMYKITQRYSPCSICAKNYIIEKPTWYIDYLDLKAKCKHFEISE